MNRILSSSFYSNYYGHKSDHLEQIISSLRRRSDGLIFLAGDSSNDNKHWLSLEPEVKAINGYENILDPPSSVPDITYHFNKRLEEKGIKYCAINCAVEEATIGDKKQYGLLSQDQIIQKNITNDDILIVSIGGNDVGLKPSLNTIWNMSKMLFLNKTSTIENYPTWAWGMPYFINMFSNSVKDYVVKLINGKKPKKIVICTIYYPDEKQTGSWADRTLGYLGYNTNPVKLQAAIKKIFELGTSKIKIDDVEVVAFPLFKVLDGKTSSDYVQRVEPSSQGGRKIENSLIDVLFNK